MCYKINYSSPIGNLLLVSDGENLTGLWIEKQKYYENVASQEVWRKKDLPVFVQVKKWLDAYFNGEDPSISDLPLAPKGGNFRQMVWEILRGIPKGQLLTYGEIAKMITEKTGKKRMSAQAVGGAVGNNPISIIIPCHRVVGANGNLTGYGGGLDLKIKLLKLEGVDMSRLFRPKGC